ncbi:MAG TPA: hypothetical protein VFL14_01660, partial [Xanthomonadales bacterium]|nr:hypothetical protein [Xanthomonadales bacterium]
GVPRAFAERAGLASDATLAGFALVPIVRTVRTAPPQRLGFVTAYPPYDYFDLSVERTALAVELVPGERLLASNLLVFFNPWEAEARVDGVLLAPLARSENTTAWACPGPDGGCTIELALLARRQDRLQAMVVRAR